MKPKSLEALAQMPDLDLFEDYQKWKQHCNYRESSLKKLPPIQDCHATIGDGGAAMTDEPLALLRYLDKIVVVEVPAKIAAEYAMADVVQHAAYLLAMTRDTCPKRARVNAEGGVFSLNAMV